MSAGTPLVALVGCKRSKLAWLGGMRVLSARDGRLRLIDKQGRVDVDEPIDALVVRLTRTKTVELQLPGGMRYVYGVPELGNVPKALNEILIREGENAEVLGPTPTGMLGVYSPKAVTGPVQVARHLVEGLCQRGASTTDSG